jgi:hypothetical protein
MVRGVRQTIILHEWGDPDDTRSEKRYDRLAVYLTDYDLDYDDAPDPSVWPQWKRLIAVTAGCVAVLSSPQAVCLAGWLGGLLLLLRAVRETARCYERALVLRTRHRRGRHRAPRRTLLSMVAGTPGAISYDETLTVARVHQRLTSNHC